jgi:hypothetical protein
VSDLSWSGGTCGIGNFIISNAYTDIWLIGVNALDQTSGRTFVELVRITT